MSDIQINGIYYPLLENKDRYLILYGGSGSGKSIFAAQKFLFRLGSEQGHRILYVRKVQKTIRNSCYKLLKDLVSSWDAMDLYTFRDSDMSITFKPNGNELIASGMDDPEKIKSIAGITSIWVEEATELTKEDFQQLDLRLRGETETYKQIILSFNPIDENHWIKETFFNGKDNTTVVKSTYRDNKFIDSEYARVLSELEQQDENYYRIYALGEWGGRPKGLIYSNWNLVDEFPQCDEIFYGLDFGFNNPSSLIQIGLKDNIIFLREVLYNPGLTNQDLINFLIQNIPNKRLDIYADAAEPDRIEEIHRAGFNVKEAKKDVKDGIDFVKRYSLKITKDSVNLLQEIRGYKWKEDKNGQTLEEPVKFKDHAMDAMRYGIYTHLLNKATTFAVSWSFVKRK